MASFVGATVDQASNTNSVDLTAQTPTVGNNLVIVAKIWDSLDLDMADFTVTDDEGNTWDIDYIIEDITSDQHVLYAVLNDVPSYTTSIVITIENTASGSGNKWWGVAVMEYSGNDFTFQSGQTLADSSGLRDGPSYTANDINWSALSHAAPSVTITPQSGTGTWTQRAEDEGTSNGQPINVVESTSSGTIQAQWLCSIVGTTGASGVAYSEDSGTIEPLTGVGSAAADGDSVLSKVICAEPDADGTPRNWESAPTASQPLHSQVTDDSDTSYIYGET